MLYNQGNIKVYTSTSIDSLTFSFPCLHEYIRYRLAELGVDTEAVPKLLVESVAESLMRFPV